MRAIAHHTAVFMQHDRAGTAGSLAAEVARTLEREPAASGIRQANPYGQLPVKT